MIRLEILERIDLDKIMEWNSGNTAEDLLQWSGSRYKYPLTKKQLDDYFNNEVEKKDSNIYLYKIILNETSETIGTLQLKIVDDVNKVGWISRVLIGKEKDRGKGFGTAATREALRIAFEDLELQNVGLGVFDFNYTAIKCYQKVGFTRGKFIKDARKAPNGYWNLYEMHISKIQWQFEIRRRKLLEGRY